jgi:hypothetical protein
MNSLGFLPQEQALKHHQKQWLLSKPISNYERNTMETENNDTITKQVEPTENESFETIPFSNTTIKAVLTASDIKHRR